MCGVAGGGGRPANPHAAQTLDIMHRKAGLCHGDIKPDNILVEQSDGRRRRILLCDFGSAQQIGGKAKDGKHAWFGTLGTKGFEAPEVASRSMITPASDVYALGVTLYRLAGVGARWWTAVGEA